MRVKRGFVSRRKHKRVLKLAEGFRGRRKNCYRLGKLAVEKALQYQFRDRRVKKREFRSLWIVRINAAARLSGMTYSRFMRGLKAANVELDRKVLADIALNDPAGFATLADQARSALA